VNAIHLSTAAAFTSGTSEHPLGHQPIRTRPTPGLLLSRIFTAGAGDPHYNRFLAETGDLHLSVAGPPAPPVTVFTND
jgi:hypothetical protein